MRTAVAVSWGGQGSHLFGLTKFHDISIIFPGFFSKFPGIFLIIIARKRSLAQGNIFTPVCHSVHRGACVVVGGVHVCGGHAWLQGGMCGCRGACVVGGMHRIQQDTVNERVVCILLECILVFKV